MSFADRSKLQQKEGVLQDMRTKKLELIMIPVFNTSRRFKFFHMCVRFFSCYERRMNTLELNIYESYFIVMIGVHTLLSKILEAKKLR